MIGGFNTAEELEEARNRRRSQRLRGVNDDGVPRGHPMSHEEVPELPAAPAPAPDAFFGTPVPVSAPAPAPRRRAAATYGIDGAPRGHPQSHEEVPQVAAEPQPAAGGAPAGPAGSAFPKTQAEIQAAIAKRLFEKPDETALIAEAKRREGGAQNDFIAGLALSALGGESFSPVGGHVLTQALKNKQPHEIPGGWGTVTGEGVTWNPGKQREADLSHLQFLDKQMTDSENRKLTRQDARDKWESDQALRRDLQAERIAARHAGGGSGEGKAQRTGTTTPDGKPLMFDPSKAEHFYIDDNGARVPFRGGAQISQGALDKQVEAVQKANASVSRLSQLDAMVKANPRAFGGIATLANLTPDLVKSRWMSAKLTPEESNTRAAVMQHASEIINNLYGAAVSAGEEKRANAFTPTADDNPEMIARKLQAALSWARHQQSAYGHLIRGVADRRSGAAPAPGGGAPQLPAGVTVERER